MAKRRKKSKKRERIPVIDFLLDMAQAATLDYIAYKRRQKRGNKRTKIDPYEATGMAMGMGLIDDTEDLIRFGGMLGAMGAFDPDEPDEVYQSSYVGSYDSNPFYAPKDNKYAWRLNCEDGSEYGISPEDYETRDEYHEALHREKYAWRDYCDDGSAYGVDPEDYETEEEYEDALECARTVTGDMLFTDEVSIHENMPIAVEESFEEEDEGDLSDEQFPETAVQPITVQTSPVDMFEDDDFHVFIYCKVETEQGIDYYRTENTTIKKGDSVTVSLNGLVLSGKVLSVERHMRFSVPKPVKETYLIIK